MKKLLPPPAVISALAKRVSKEDDTDVVFYCGEIVEPFDFTFVHKIKRYKKHDNLLIILATFGGSADAAYRMMRYVHCTYGEKGRISLFIPRICKSAGTLMAVGADELIMSDVAEIGPLDVQVRKPDELGEWTSGLTPLQALSALRNEAFSCFEQHFLSLRERSNRQITARTAAEIAVKLTVGWFQPIYEQLDPMRLSETQRAMSIAWEYGQRLIRKNINEQGLNRLITDYPSHGFIIDRNEAHELFSNVRGPKEGEGKLFHALMRAHLLASGLHPDADPEIWFISGEDCDVSTDIEWKGDEYETEAAENASKGSKSELRPPLESGNEKPVRSNGRKAKPSPIGDPEPGDSHE